VTSCSRTETRPSSRRPCASGLSTQEHLRGIPSLSNDLTDIGILKINEDVSFTLFVQKDEPANPVAKANCLPAPDSPVYMHLRRYWPKDTALDALGRPPLPAKKTIEPIVFAATASRARCGFPHPETRAMKYHLPPFVWAL
jgi:hypothetical protein